jgi:hypothetical protein
MHLCSACACFLGAPVMQPGSPESSQMWAGACAIAVRRGLSLQLGGKAHHPWTREFFVYGHRPPSSSELAGPAARGLLQLGAPAAADVDGVAARQHQLARCVVAAQANLVGGSGPSGDTGAVFTGGGTGGSCRLRPEIARACTCECDSASPLMLKNAAHARSCTRDAPQRSHGLAVEG